MKQAKLLLAFLITFFGIGVINPSVVDAATNYYVAAASGSWTDETTNKAVTVGNPSDSNNGTSWASPFLTVSKALSAARSDGLSTARLITVAPGTYAEDDGNNRFLPWGAFTQTQTIKGLTGVASDVIITATNNSGGAALDLTTSKTTQNITIQSVTIEAPISGTHGASASGPYAISIPTVSTINNLNFVGCVLQCNRWSTQKENVHISGSGTSSNIRFIRCTFTENTSLNPSALPSPIFYLLPSGLNDLITGFTVDGCTAYTINGGTYQTLKFLDGAFALQAQGLNNFTVVRNTFCSQTSFGFIVGRDGSGSGLQPNTGGYIGGNRFVSLNSHACLIGGGTTLTTFEGNDVESLGDQGLVCKDPTSITVKNNRFRGLSSTVLTVLYNKGGRSCTYTDNLVVAQSGATQTVGWKESRDQVDLVLSYNTSFTYNTLITFGSSQAIMWDVAAYTDGGGVSNNNTYGTFDSSVIGQIRSVTNVNGQTGSTIVDKIRSAWASAGLTGETLNDSASRLYTLAYQLPQASATSNARIYGIIWDFRGYAWNGAAFEPFDGTKPWKYSRWAYEQGTIDVAGFWRGSGKWLIPVPKLLPYGSYLVEIFQPGTGPAASTDTRLVARELAWNGSNVLGLTDATRKGN